MKKTIAIVFTAIAAILLACSCTGAGSGESGNFEQSAALEYARGFNITEHEGYSVVTIREPWDTLKVRRTYILVPKGEPIPDPAPKGTVIRIPVEKAVVYTSVHSSAVEQLGCLSQICGVCEKQYMTSPAIRQAVNDETIADLGLSSSPDIEKIIDLEADVIIATPFENSGYGTAEKLNIPIVEIADYMENSPLGRTEWIKLIGLLFGAENTADSLFKATCGRYDELKELASGCNNKPTVLLERKYGATWGVPGADSYIATFHRDAGAKYIFDDVPGTNSVQMSFEAVFDKAVDADFWLLKHTCSDSFSYDKLKKEYQPYANFEAFKKHSIFGCNTIDTPYYDDITLHPDLILKDFISIYHPDLLPGYTRKYYKELDN